MFGRSLKRIRMERRLTAYVERAAELLPEERVLFSANRFVSNGRVPPITHIVYVDPEGYDQLGELSHPPIAPRELADQSPSHGIPEQAEDRGRTRRRHRPNISIQIDLFNL